MQGLRPLLRWSGSARVSELSRCLSPAIRVKGLQYRAQHDQSGPHKEYFQVPGQEPRPDLTPYIRESQGSSYFPDKSQQQPTAQAGSIQPADSQPQPPPSTRWLRIPRIIRSAIWFLLFLQLGAVTGTALITWEYLSPPFEPGSPEEQELIEEITETLESHPMVDELREQGWTEVDAFTPDIQHGLKGRNMVHQVLGGNNTQGIFMRVFHHPGQEYTMLVFFLGFGVEGWPDVIHGGIIASVLEEGLTKHVAHFYPGHFTTPEKAAKIDFKKPCKPGEIYGVLVAPSGREASKSGNVHLTKLTLTSLLVQLTGAPVVNTEFNITTNTEVHTIGIPAQTGQQPTHAICQAEIKLIPKQVAQNGKAFEVGATDDPGFARALDFLKSRPEFKNSRPPPSDEEKKEED